MKKLFVYGTLMSGQGASSRLRESKRIGVFRLPDYAMYDLGSFPGITECPGESVIGEVYEISDELLDSIDDYEGEGSLYIRKNVTVYREKSKLDVFVYVYNQNISACELMRESWNAKEDDYVWYAGYGSNLSEDRFECYIKGGINPYNTKKSNVGCRDKSMWTDEKIRDYEGRLYFGNVSSTWDNKGVAFFDPDAKRENRPYRDNVHMHLYKITREQLHEIQNQEGNYPNWYGRLYCLEVLEDDCPVYTLTSEKPVKENEPWDVYADLIRESLINHLGSNREFEIDNYIAELSPGLNVKVRQRLQRVMNSDEKHLSTCEDHYKASANIGDSNVSLVRKLEEKDMQIKELQDEIVQLKSIIAKIKNLIND